MSEQLFLRKIKPSDSPWILKWENNIENWAVSNTQRKFSPQEIDDFVFGSHNIEENKQLRLMICSKVNENPMGCIDLFEYEKGNSVGVGVLIADKKDRNKGYAKDSLKLLIEFVKNELDVKTIFCSIFLDNTPSIRLFEGAKFTFIENRILYGKLVKYYELRIK